MTTMPTLRGTYRSGAPAAAQITALQAVREYPAISVLITTTPAAQLTHADTLRLNALASRAIQRVSVELQPAAARPAVRGLANLVAQARHGPTARALAVYASASTQALVRLPITVRDRAVVDPTFATRDLVRALQCTPRHLVLVLEAGHAWLFEAAGDTLLPAVTLAFPMHADPGPDFYRQVDAALGAYLRRHPAPLVLVGDDRATAAFRRVSTNCTWLAGTVPGNLTTTAGPDLTARVRVAVETYLHRRQDEALTLIAERVAAGRVASGVPAAWRAARAAQPELLAVDESLFYPARISDDGDTLTPADDVEHPDVIDDAVDELIELVLIRGGWIAFTRPGGLDHHQGVAVAVRP
jgi:hypothetical protein